MSMSGRPVLLRLKSVLDSTRRRTLVVRVRSRHKVEIVVV